MMTNVLEAELPVAAPTNWTEFGFAPPPRNAEGSGDLVPSKYPIVCTIPEGLIALTVLKADAKDMNSINNFPLGGMLSFLVGDRSYFYFRLHDNARRFDGSSLPGTIRLLQAGDVVPLPVQLCHPTIRSVADIAVVQTRTVQRALTGPSEPEIINSPLAQYSLRGKAAEFADLAVQAKPLLGDLCLSGQSTVFYAAPNVGKTLVSLRLVDDAINDGRIQPGNVFYLNADDSSAGFAEKMQLMDDLGVHTLSPGFREFRPEGLIDLLHDVAARDKARGTLIIIDTVKKFSNLMDKGKASAFTQACRQVAMRGGAILGLAHTTKSPNSNGTLRYAGTTDMVDDFDAAYVIAPLEASPAPGEKVVMFQAIKRRGNNAESVAYAYAAEGNISYVERLASVRLVDPATIGEFQRVEAERADADVIAAVEACICDGITAKMELAREAALRSGVSQRSAVRLIEAYTGSDPLQHHWTYAVRERGAKVFSLLEKPVEQAYPSPTPLAA